MKIEVILHNIRSTYNVGAILRTCEGFGVDGVVYSGYTPVYDDATLLPHQRGKINRQIAKVALGAEKLVTQRRAEDITEELRQLREAGGVVVGLENNLEGERVVELSELAEGIMETAPEAETGRKSKKFGPVRVSIARVAEEEPRVALLLGEEVAGIPGELHELVDIFAEIPMRGEKESFNVSVATGIALYELCGRETT